MVVWREWDAVDVGEINGVIVGCIFPWGGRFASCLEGEYIITHDNKFEARAEIEKTAAAHLAKASFIQNPDSDPEFVPNHKSLAFREQEAREFARISNAELSF